jgi:hypothetical protein
VRESVVSYGFQRDRGLQDGVEAGSSGRWTSDDLGMLTRTYETAEVFAARPQASPCCCPWA